MRRKTNEEFLNEIFTLTQGEYTPLEPYKNNKTAILMRHNCSYCHNHEWASRPDHFLHENKRCPICSINKRNEKLTKAHTRFTNEVYQLYGNEFSVLSHYHGNKSKIAIRHNSSKCNFHISYPIPNNFLRKPSCPICSHASTSFEEQYVYLILKSIIPEVKNRVKIGNRECDIFIPSMEIGIQYDGAYYHQDRTNDDTFNDLFFESGGKLLFRIREKKCPDLSKHENLLIIEPSHDTIKPKTLIRICGQIIRKINSIIHTHYSLPHDSELVPLITEANKRVLNSERYQNLFEELKEFYKQYNRFPKRIRKTPSCYENKLAERIYYAKKRKIFSENQIASIALSS